MPGFDSFDNLRKSIEDIVTFLIFEPPDSVGILVYQ